MANRLYNKGMDDQYSDLRQMNAVAAIGYIGCNLEDITEVARSALTILQQRFNHPPSKLDNNIIEQFANILLTGKVSNF